MRFLKLLLIGSLVVAVAGCASKGSSPEDDGSEMVAGSQGSAEGEGSRSGDDADGAPETFGGQGEERMSVSPLDDPSSALAQRVIYFEFDRSDVRADYVELIAAHARYLVANPDQRIRLEGHADERGTREYNVGLGDRRNQAVRRMLMFQGVSDAQIQTVSYGEERPVAYGHDEESWELNRRVEIVYIRR